MKHRFIEYNEGNGPCPLCAAVDEVGKLSRELNITKEALAIEVKTKISERVHVLERKLQTAIDHLKDWAGYASSGAKYSVGDHEIYQPQISVASVDRLWKTIEMLERG